MRNPRTTIFGAIAASSAALSQVKGLPSRLEVASVAIAAIAGALCAFFAKDAEPAPTIPAKLIGVILASAILAIAAGCTLSRLRTAISSPTFGSLDISIGGGTIGNATQETEHTTNRSGTHHTNSTTARFQSPGSTNSLSGSVTNNTRTNASKI